MGWKTFLPLLLPSIVLANLAFSERKQQYIGATVYHVFGDTDLHKEAFLTLSEQYDVWREPQFEEDSMDVLVLVEQMEEFMSLVQLNAFRLEVMIEDVGVEILRQDRESMLSKMKEGENLVNFDYNRYHNLPEIERWMSDIAVAYPGLVEMFQVADSYEGRVINAFKISTGGFGKPAMWLDGGIHAREWISPATMLYFVKYLLEGASTDPEIQDMIGRADWYILPVFNVDGFDRSHMGDRLWRKTVSPTPGSTCIGCDPNRNWDHVWGGVGTSPNPCSQTFPGREAFSEVEVRKVADFIAALPNVKTVLSYHNYGQMYMVPYGYQYQSNPDFAAQMSICNDVISAIFNTHGQVYRCNSLINLVGPNSGSSVDYAYAVLKIKYSFGMELRDRGTYGFFLPENQIQATAEENFNGLKVLAKRILDE